MGQQIVGGTPGPSGCVPLLGALLMGAVCIALLAMIHWPRR